jgi:hypothetical protein
MADYAYVLRAPYAVSDTSLTKVYRDPLLKDAKDGVRFLWDTAFPWSYPAGDFAGRQAAGAPAADALIRDISEHNNGAFRKLAAGTVGFAGGGFELKTLTGRHGYVEVPAAVNADIWNPAPAGAAVVGGSQLWLECLYLWAPDPRLWTGPAANSFCPIMQTSGTDAAPTAYYATTPEKAWVGVKADGAVVANFQSPAMGNNNTINYTSSILPHIGKLTQIATWRSGAGATQSGLMIRSSVSRNVSNTSANGVAANADSYAASKTKIGIGPSSIWPASGLDMSQSPFRIYRGFTENLARSGRNPLTVLDDDWARVQARIAASAAANGGTSLIFA